jgi:TolB-like protein
MQLTTSLPKEVVETQLSRVIGSRQLCNSPRLSRFLTYVVEESLAGRPDRLKGYTIGVEAFDRPEDFDPQTDTIVRVQARALRQKLDQYYAQDGLDDPVHITIPKGSYEPSFYVSWDGEKPEDVGVTSAVARSTKPSIAVLPFDDFSHQEGNDFFAHGVTEEIISNLSRFRDLSVFSRSTTEKAKLDNQSIPEIHKALGADFVLEGSTRVRDQEFDISINLVDASTDAVILTDRFHHEATPDALYKIQDELAVQIAAQITDRFGPLGHYAGRAARSGQAQKWETYYWISRYHQYAVQLSPETRQEIKEGLIKALESDAESSDAHAALSLILADEYRLSLGDGVINDLPGQVWKQAQIAVTCDPQNAIAHEALATAFYHRGDFGNFDRSAQQALRLNPGNGDMIARIGMCYGARANWDVALPLFDKAIELSPFHPGWYHVMRAVIFAMTTGPNEALAEIKVSPMPDVFFYQGYLIWFLVELGDMKAARREKEVLMKLLPDFERVAGEHARLWHLDASITNRLYAAWRKVGLNVGHDQA